MYANLAAWITGVRDWLDADHLTDDQITGFVNLAQARLNRELNAWEMEATSPRTVALGVITLPADFNRIRQVSVANVGTYDAVSKGDLVNATAVDDKTRRIFAVDAGAIQFWPTLADGVVVDVDYFVKVPAISVSINTNLFTTYFSDLMLWAALIEGHTFIDESDRAQLFEVKYLAALNTTNLNPKRVKMGSTPLRRINRMM